MVEKILLDTDIGSDVDDAVCLAYLLAQPDCDLLGITTVAGEGLNRAKLASVLCNVAGRDVPIFPGTEDPILVDQLLTTAAQATVLDKWDHRKDFPRGQAVHFLQQTIRANPNQITLLTIGPLTNVGLLFAMDPEIPRLLKQMVMMVGIFNPRIAGVGSLEWNAFGDPHATTSVFRRPAKVHRCIGFDITVQVEMKPEEVRRAFQHELLQPVLDYAEIWFQKVPRLVFHDPVAAASIFDDQLCAFERGTVEVELASERLAGYTHWTSDAKGPHQVAVSVAPERFFAHFFSTFTGI
jgi:inosine-uridine nucleoside N-ribohydrolase